MHGVLAAHAEIAEVGLRLPVRPEDGLTAGVALNPVRIAAADDVRGRHDLVHLVVDRDLIVELDGLLDALAELLEALPDGGAELVGANVEPFEVIGGAAVRGDVRPIAGIGHGRDLSLPRWWWARWP